MRLALALMLALIVAPPAGDAQVVHVIKATLPTASVEGVPGYKMTRKDGAVYVLKRFHLDGASYVVTDVRDKITQHRADAVLSIVPLGQEPLRLETAAYVQPGASTAAGAARVAARTQARTAARGAYRPAATPTRDEPDAASIARLQERIEAARVQEASAPRYSSASAGDSGESSLCGATTKKGAPCRRRVKGGGHRYQHGG